MRTLIHIPIIHTQADMGGLAESVRKITIEQLGQQQWEGNIQAINKLWNAIRGEINSWDLPYERVRLYQDGLPVCGREVEIVTELAKTGSPNHQLLVILMNRGATLMGTESPDLLRQEYQLMQQVLAARDPQEAIQIAERQKALSRALLEKRDEYVAERINSTLRDGEIGILFLGLLHSLQGKLAPDTRVSYPIQIGSQLKDKRA